MDRGAWTDLYGGIFRWHGRYLPPATGPGWLQLIGETGAYRFDSPIVLALAQVLARGDSLESYCRSHQSAAGLLAGMLHALDGLLRQGFVQPAAGLCGENYHTPDFSRPFVRTSLAHGADAIVLSELIDAADAANWASSAYEAQPGRGSLTFVFCDDYLDTRLERIDTEQTAMGRAWLLVRPAGEQAMLGPLFKPRVPGAACWHCLAHRLMRNQPARAWWQAHSGGPVPALPVRHGPALLQGRWRTLQPCLQEVLAGSRHGLLFTPPDSGDPVGTPRVHAVTARPQCARCGNPGLLAEQQRRPVVPASCLRLRQRDGGSRSMPAADTVQRLLPELSALCGAITEVAPLGEEDGDGLRVYRSGIFRTPLSEGAAPPPESWLQWCLGKGMSAEQSRASAMCEAIERYAAFYQGDEALVTAAAEELDARCIPPQALAYFSARQHETGEARRLSAGTLLQAPVAPEPGETMSWAPAWSLTHQARCYLPLGYCYAHAPAHSTRHAGWTSNGCAAGNTLEEAILQGLLELVERDAAAIWWYNQLARPRVDLDGLRPEFRARVGRTLGPAWRHWVMDIRHDFGIPVAAAVGHHQHSGAWAVGFGCSLDAAVACERALTEICQLVAAGKQFAVADAHSAFLLGAAAAGATPRLRSECAQSSDIADEIGACVRAARALGMEVLALDYSRPDIALHCVKMVVPGLCHIWPERANPRLYQVPVTMGWRDRPLVEEELNPQGLYV